MDELSSVWKYHERGSYKDSLKERKRWMLQVSLREFHRTRPSGSGVPHVTKDDSTESESESWGNDEDDSNDENDSENEGNDEENKSDDDKTPFDSEKEVKYDDEEEDEFAHTPPNIDDKEAANLESKNDDKIEDIHPNDAKIVSPLDVHVHHEVPRTHTSTLLIVQVSVIPKSSPQVNQLPQNLPEKVSNFAPPVNEKMIEESLNQVNLAKASSQLQSTYEAAATLIEF
nr:hypothetical protein [Tanacetum cinerariifolium]